MPEIDCVVFDVGNVLVRWDPLNLYRRMGYADAAATAILDEIGLVDLNHRALDAGAPFGTTLAELSGRFPHHAAFIQAFGTRWEDALAGAVAPNVEILRRLKRNGVPVYAISNFSREKFDITRALFGFLDTFDDLVISGDVGVVKPDPVIFNILIGRRRFDPGRAIFIDDSAANIETARRLGFATVLFLEGETDLAAELVKLGLREQALSA